MLYNQSHLNGVAGRHYKAEVVDQLECTRRLLEEGLLGLLHGFELLLQDRLVVAVRSGIRFEGDKVGGRLVAHSPAGIVGRRTGEGVALGRRDLLVDGRGRGCMVTDVDVGPGECCDRLALRHALGRMRGLWRRLREMSQSGGQDSLPGFHLPTRGLH